MQRQGLCSLLEGTDSDSTQLYRFCTASADPHIEHLHKHGKRHGKIDVTLGYVHIESLSDKGHSDQEEKAQCQNLDRGMTFNKAADGSGHKNHNNYGNDDCSDHDGQLIDETYGRNHRVE